MRPIAIAVQLRPLTPFPLPFLPHSMPKTICRHSELFCLHIKTHSPQKNLALKCAVNYCLLLREIRICPSIRNISRLHHRQQMGVHHGVMYLQHSARYLAGRVCSRWFLRALRGETGLNIPCYRLHLSAQCLPELGLCQVQGGGKTVMHCLPPTFSSFPCSDTGEVCLAASETVLSSNQPATTIATIISSSVIFFFFSFLMCHLSLFLSKWSESKWYTVF